MFRCRRNYAKTDKHRKTPRARNLSVYPYLNFITKCSCQQIKMHTSVWMVSSTMVLVNAILCLVHHWPRKYSAWRTFIDIFALDKLSTRKKWNLLVFWLFCLSWKSDRSNKCWLQLFVGFFAIARFSHPTGVHRLWLQWKIFTERIDDISWKLCVNKHYMVRTISIACKTIATARSAHLLCMLYVCVCLFFLFFSS